MTDLDDLLAPAGADQGGCSGPGSFEDVHAFVAHLIAPAYARDVRDADTHAKWCSRWHEHHAAAWRLDALWRTWRNLPDNDPDAVCAWWLDRADPTIAVLTDPLRGPFVGCGPTRHHAPPALPVTGIRTSSPGRPAGGHLSPGPRHSVEL